MKMALSSTTISDYQKLKKSSTIQKKQLMLKDYLLDDLSSCSSSGFKSFPRRQCCSTVRFLVELDLKSQPKKPTTLHRSRSKAASTTINALQRVSVAVLNAVKLLPFPSSSVKSLTHSKSVKKTAAKGILPRSLSRKIFKKSFWRRTEDNENNNNIKRWKSFAEYLEEKEQPLDRVTLSTDNVVVTNRVSTDTSSNSNTSWDASVSDDFTSDILRSNSEMSSENVVATDYTTKIKSVLSTSQKNGSSNGKSVGVTVGEESSETTTTITTTSSDDSNRVWPNEGKEQFSPVSVLDCPFEDDEEITSPFPCAKQRAKARRIGKLSQLAPVDLEKRIQTPGLNATSPKPALKPILDNKEENKAQLKEEQLLSIIKKTNPTSASKLDADILLLDFFAEGMQENENGEHDLLKIAQDWINGRPQKLYSGWEVKENRKIYLKDMERCGRWKKIDQEKEELGFALELECWTSLVDDLVYDLMHC